MCSWLAITLTSCVFGIFAPLEACPYQVRCPSCSFVRRLMVPRQFGPCVHYCTLIARLSSICVHSFAISRSAINIMRAYPKLSGIGHNAYVIRKSCITELSAVFSQIITSADGDDLGTAQGQLMFFRIGSVSFNVGEIITCPPCRDRTKSLHRRLVHSVVSSGTYLHFCSSWWPMIGIACSHMHHKWTCE